MSPEAREIIAAAAKLVAGLLDAALGEDGWTSQDLDDQITDLRLRKPRKALSGGTRAELRAIEEAETD
ncbi:MAG: hypothetical protein GY944_24495 [bacterium]|nr:hypothetical protein [bacterium]